MLPIFLWILGPILAALSVRAQDPTAAQWCDSQTKICFQRYYISDLDVGLGYIFPPLPSSGAAPDDFIGIYTAPAGAGWIGNSLGGGMTNSLLIVGWMNGGTPVVSARRAGSYSLPATYAGPKLTVLGSSGVNSTHQRIVYRCQNCTTWSGGSIPLTSTSGIFGYAINAAIKPDTPSDPGSRFLQHTLAGQHGIDITKARTSQYSTYLSQLASQPTGSPTVSPTGSPTPTVPVPTGPLSCPNAPRPTYSVVAAPGYSAIPVLGKLTSPRGIAIDTAGHLLVIERGKGLTVHVLDATGCVTSSKTLISDTGLNHGIDATATKLFASTVDAAYVWDYNPTAMTVSNKKTLVTGMNHADHITRTVWNSRKYPNLLIVSSGSDANIDLASFSPSAGRAIVKVYDYATLPSNGVNIAAGGKVLGYGLRNDVAVLEDKAGIIHTVENSCDDAYRTVNGNRADVHTDNPAEKVYNLGDPSTPNTAFFGGYPYCFTVWQPSSFRDKTFQTGDWFVQAPNSTLTDAWCETNAKKPTALLPPHTAPLDAKFGVGSDSAMYVALHGSWNRNPPQGYKVVSIPGSFSSSGQWAPTGPLSSRTGFSDVIKNPDEGRCNSGCFRPVGLAWNAGGYNLYVSSDTSGEVFLVRKAGVAIVNPPSPTISTPTPTPTPIQTPTPTPTPQPPTTVIPEPPTTVIPEPPTTVAPPEPTQTLYGQCGGRDYKGPTSCPGGSTCKFSNDYYSQCVPG